MTAASTYTNGSDAASPKQEIDNNLNKIILVDQLPSDAWAEGVTIRPSGNVITTRIDEPEIYLINSASTKLSNEFDVVKPKLLHTFKNATGVFNLCPLKSDKEEYAVISGWADMAKVEFLDFVLWRLVMPADGSDEAPEVTKIADIGGGQFCMGMVAISERTLLICDAHQSCIWRVDIPTGTVSVLIEDETMRPQKGEFYGINRLRILAGYLWFTNTSTGKLCRAPIEYIDNDNDIQITGSVEIVADGMSNAEGLVLTKDARFAFINSYVSGTLWRVDIDLAAGKGTPNVLREDLLSPTAMDLVYEDKKPTLYILCCGSIDESWIQSDMGRWFELAGVRDKIQITVTVEVTVSYE